MLGAYRPHSNLRVGNISIVVFVDVGECWDCACLVEASEPGCRASCGFVGAAHSPHTKVRHGVLGIAIGITSPAIELLRQLQVHLGDCSVVAGLPEFSLKNALNPLDKPSEVVVGVRDFDAGDTHVHRSPLGDCPYLQRQITKSVEVNHTRHIVATLGQLNFHVLLIFRNHIVDFPIKEVFLEVVNKELLDERLKTEEYHLVVCFQHALARRPIGVEFRQSLGVHVAMHGFIRVA